MLVVLKAFLLLLIAVIVKASSQHGISKDIISYFENYD